MYVFCILTSVPNCLVYKCKFIKELTENKLIEGVRSFGPETDVAQ